MKPTGRKVLAVFAGLAVFALCACGAIIAGFIISASLGGPAGSVIPDKEAVYPSQYGDIYFQSGFFGLAFVAGASTTLILWERRMTSKRSASIYFLCIAILLPIAAINFASGDFFIRRSVQFGIDLILVFLGLTVLPILLKLRPQAVGLKVLKGFAVFFLLFQVVIIPSAYSLLWILNWEKVTVTANPAWISGFASLSSAVISFLTYKRTATPKTENNIIKVG